MSRAPVTRRIPGAGGGGAPSRAAEDLERLRRVTRWMDEAIRVPGTRIRVGLDALVGLIPGAGDLLGGVVSAGFLVAAVRAGAPPAVLLRMSLNVAADVLVGTVPFVGDVFDFAWKANTRNLALLETLHEDPIGTARRSRRALWFAAIASLAAVALALAGSLWVAARAVRWLLPP